MTQLVPQLALEGPPCAGCAHWNPQPKTQHTERGYVFDGQRLCHAADMFSDFSCYRPKPEPLRMSDIHGYV